ncbi:MAG: AAA family ATPase, partial [Caloramator sp.]|nr:AAA family ATPase [Caloramator sp.]
MLNEKVREKIKKLNLIGDELKGYIVEKDEVIHLIKIALISKRNVFFLGKTGQAKSYTVREFVKRIEGANYFEILMNKMLDTENIFGRLDIPSLIKGEQKIITKGKLPEAHINFLDEIFKSNEIILNSFLQVLNYEEINLEGNIVKPPTIATFAASNEIPDFKKPEDEILYPLYNRLHLK